MTTRDTRAAVLAATLVACLAGNPLAQVVDRVMAVVGAAVVTLSDARAVLAFGVVQPVTDDPLGEAVDYLVNRQLILGEVNRYAAPPPDPAVLEQRLSAVRGRFPNAAALQAAMSATAVTEARLRDFAIDTLRIEAYLDQRFSAQAQPTPEEVERYFRDHAAEFAVEGRVPDFEEARPAVQAPVHAERRAALIADWLDRLRRRSTIRLARR
jgi:hypothetical protein